MRFRSSLALSLLALLPGPAWAQTAPVEGLRDNTPQVHALTGARIVVAPGNVIENGTLVIRDGVIEAVGARVTPPADARIWDLSGRTLFAGFIDVYSDVGMPKPSAEREDSARGPIAWNPQIRAHVDAAAELSADDARVQALRAQGFTVAMAVPRVGMFRGRTAVVGLGDGPVRDRVVRSGVAHAVTLQRDNSFGFGYPTSAMGAVAFIRQTLHDADWHMRAWAAYNRNPAGLRRPEMNAALAALAPALRGEQPIVFEASTDEEVLRILAIAREFSITPWIRASGYEYRLVDALSGLRAPLIVPVAYPDVPNVERPEAALNVSLADLRHWYRAPENPGRLAAAGLTFALTADGLDDRSKFLPNVRLAVRRGLSPDAALAALTTIPARYLGLERTHGTLEAGKVANIVVADGNPFTDSVAIRDVWIDGRRYEVTPAPAVDPRGQWNVVASGDRRIEGRLTLEGTPERLSGSFSSTGGEVRLGSARLWNETRRLQVSFPASAVGGEGVVRLSFTVSGDALYGWGEMPDGTRLTWKGTRTRTAASEPAGGAERRNGTGDVASTTTTANLTLPEIRPAMEYGRPSAPEQPEYVLVRNATIWTMGPDGIIQGGDLLVRRGKIERIGRNLEAPRGAVVIDAAGKHVTPGLIDPHLHSGVSGAVNEMGSAIVPEVRIGDVLTMDNIWMYRQLAGGLTTAHIMHGSANPIGGQNQVVKMRWGALPEEMRFEGAPRTVKFALGENVKRRTGRYPDTRMGTEQIIRDHFKAALDYRQAWQEWERGDKRGIPPRRDLRMDALVDILEGRIQIMSHSYRQDEILMLIRLAEEFGAKVRAFHHTVEGYKVASEIARHGAAAVVWSDWGGFKIEAYDNTTFNARVLHEAGVLTSLHSDDSQIASRMNWEAAKMLRTGLSEEQALALVTINPAKILGIADRVGSLEPGKDADFVIWSGSPLSTYAKAEQTWVDGRKYFDLEEDRRLREEIDRERAKLIQLALERRGGRGGER